MFQPSPWRADFPAIAALQRQHQTYLDSAATTQKPQPLLDALSHYYGHGAANVHRAQHLPGALATQAFETSRDKVATWLNAADSRQIVFTHGATSALNLLAYGLEHRLEAGDEIAISALEHHANLLPWQQLAHRRNLRLVVLPLDAQGRIDQDQALQLIGPRTRVLAISQLSNVLGTWQPLPALLAHARAQGALTVSMGPRAWCIVARTCSNWAATSMCFPATSCTVRTASACSMAAPRPWSCCATGSSVARWCSWRSTTAPASVPRPWASKQVRRRLPG